MSENELLARIRNGGQQQLALIYEKYRSEFLHWISKEFHCSPEDSKDIYQVTILIFYDNVKSGKLVHLVSSIKTYLFGIGKNVAREHLRRLQRNTHFKQEKSLRQFFIDESDDQTDEYVFEAVNKALAKLGDSGRKLIELFYYERKSMEEICMMMNYKNADTAKNQKCKSMARLRKLFEEEMTKGGGIREGLEIGAKAGLHTKV
ncbi:MAG: sigma-70 family RNA polymerase sigma factor [Cyclobacteriaceae bacterium]